MKEPRRLGSLATVNTHQGCTVSFESSQMSLHPWNRACHASQHEVPAKETQLSLRQAARPWHQSRMRHSSWPVTSSKNMVMVINQPQNIEIIESLHLGRQFLLDGLVPEILQTVPHLSLHPLCIVCIVLVWLRSKATTNAKQKDRPGGRLYRVHQVEMEPRSSASPSLLGIFVFKRLSFKQSSSAYQRAHPEGATRHETPPKIIVCKLQCLL